MSDKIVAVKPCPFCGHIPDITDGDFCYPVNRAKSLWRVCCTESSGKCESELLGVSREDAISKWNSRSYDELYLVIDDLIDYCYTLKGEWGWKINEVGGNAEEYNELCTTIEHANRVMLDYTLEIHNEN